MGATPRLDFYSKLPADDLVGELADLYERDFAPAALKALTPEFYSRDRFIERMADYEGSPRFALVVATIDDEVIGFLTAANMIPGTAWWKDIDPEPSAEFIREDNARTVAIFDLMVTPDQRGHGYASLIHEAFLKERTEERVTLLSSEPQQPAYAMWLHWGYKIIGSKATGDSGPRLDVFIRDLKDNKGAS
jgi:GNAT superfamily N-acetyltransferase